MANIRVDLTTPICDGSPVTFKSPCDCSAITGLVIYHPISLVDKTIMSTEFKFADAHKNDVTKISELFKADAIVKIILDVTNSMAYVQNADTNAYLEGKFAETKDYVAEKLAESKEYVDSQINLVNASGIPKLGAYAYQEVATEDGQTVFPIALTTFVKDTDMVRVYSGITRLSPVSDFVVNEDATITLTEGVPIGRTIDIEIIKHIPMGEEGEVNGRIMAKGSIPLDRIIDSNLKTYTALEQIGIAVGSETIDSIMSALPYHSMLMFPVTSSYNLAQYPLNEGMCIIHKSYDSRTSLVFESAHTGRRWFAEHYNASGNITWTGWKEIFTTEGGTVDGALTINHKDGTYVLRTESGVVYKIQLSLDANGRAVINRWKDGAFQGALYVGNNSVHLLDADMSTQYPLYGTHNITKGTTGVTANSTALATNSIHLVYE